MSHIKAITKTQDPARAESLLVWAQKAEIFGTLAVGLGALAEAFDIFTQTNNSKTGNGE